MKKELTVFDWALCIGQKVLVRENIVDRLIDINLFYKNEVELVTEFKYVLYSSHKAKPILRSLDQITEEEKEEFIDCFYYGDPDIDNVSFAEDEYTITGKYPCDDHYNAMMIDWLTQKGFDLRGWIDAGLAIKYDEVEHV